MVNCMEPPKPQRLGAYNTHRGLQLVILAWVFGSVWASVSMGAQVVGFFHMLGASTLLIGFLGAAPAFSNLLQPIGSYLIEKTGQRKRFFLIFGCINRLLWFAILAVPFVFGTGTSVAVIALAVLIASKMSGAIVGSAWLSWMGDLVPVQLRGSFFGRRQRLGTAAGIAASLVAGAYLRTDPAFTKFAVVFAIAAVSGVADILLHRSVPDSQVAPEAANVRLADQFLDPWRNERFRGFLLFFVFFGFSTALLGAFMNLYLVRDLRLSYLLIAVFGVLITGLANMLFSWVWGIFMDRFGNKPVLTVCAAVCTTTPVLWVFCGPKSFALMTIIMFLGGAFWSGINLASINLQIGLSPSGTRSRFIAGYAMWSSLAAAAGSITGGALASATEGFTVTVAGLPLHGLHFVFIATAIGRLLSLPLLRFIDEPAVKPASYILRTFRTLNPLRVFASIHTFGQSAHEHRRVQAARGLGISRSELGVTDLVSALNDSSQSVREEAARALGEIGAKESVEPLIGKLKDSLANIQTESARALGKIGDSKSVEPLIESLKSDDKYLRGSAASALGEIGDNRAVEPLKELLEDEKDAHVFAAGAEALSRLGEMEAAFMILPALRQTTHPILRKQLAITIGNLLGEQGEFYRIITREERLEASAVLRLLRATRREFTRSRSLRYRKELHGALSDLEHAYTMDDTTMFAQALSDVVTALVGGESNGERHEIFQRIYAERPKLVNRLILLDHISKRKQHLLHEEVLLSFYILRCVAPAVSKSPL